LRTDEIVKGVSGLIGSLAYDFSFYPAINSITGNTPLVRVNSLSDALGIEILGKAEVSILLMTYS
jgi:cysteine synthase A